MPRIQSLPLLEVDPGGTIALEAVDAVSGLPVAGVIVRDIAISAIDLAAATGTPIEALAQLVSQA